MVDCSKGGDFDGMKDFSETKGLGMLGTFTGKTLEFGNFKLEIGAFTPGTDFKYQVVEKALPIAPKLYVNGKAANGGIASPDWRMLILSQKSRDEILSEATRAAKIFLPAGAGATALGGVLAAVAALTGGHAQAQTQTDTPAAAVATTTPAATTTAAATATAAAPADTAAASPGGATAATAAAAPAGAAGKAAYKVGDKVTVEWKGSNYPAAIIAVAGKDSYKIHYDGYAASWDEVVGPARIKGKR
jgi:hypothetical protein